MRAWFRTLLLLAAAVALALALRDHSGNVILAIPPWRIQFSTTLGALLLIALFVALHWLLRAWSWLGMVPTRLHHWRGQRAQQRDHDLFERGWISLAEGDYTHAERDFSRLLVQTRVPRRKVMAALAAARAAHAQTLHVPHARDQAGRCQTFLNTAQDYMGHDPALQRAVAATHADILLDAGQFDAALARLSDQAASQNATAPSQQPTQPLSPHLARLQLRAHDALGHHDQVWTLAREGLRRGWLAREAALPLIDRAGAHRLQQAATQSGPASTEIPDETKNKARNAAWLALWKDHKTEERVLPRIALAAASLYATSEQPEEAARVLEAAIKPQLSDPAATDRLAGLLAAYARCDANQVSQRLAKAETWLVAQPENPDLLCALATLCLTGQIWGAAERYLHRSLHARQGARAHALLGSLYDRMQRAGDARRHWQQAAALEMALPQLATDTSLPAADTRADPRMPDVAVSLSPDQDAPSPVATVATATSPRTDIEDLFDSAPIPGLDPARLAGSTDSTSLPPAR